MPFSGWRVVACSAVALAMTGPAQTNGVSVFIDPMIADLALTRSQVAGAYLVGTLLGALALPLIGRRFDTRGARATMTVMGAALGVMLIAMGGVVGLITLVIGFTGIRMLGQGGLSLTATTAVAPWFSTRRGTAVGVVGAVGSAGISLFPVLAAAVIGVVTWRWTWVLLGLLVWLVVLPVARLGIIDRPADVGQDVDGTPVDELAGGDASPVSFTRGQALRTAMFWAVAAAVATTGMIGTGLAFHQIDLLGEQGLTPVEAAANFLPQTAAAVAATFLVGTLIDHLAARWVLLGSMAMLAVAMLVVPWVSPGLAAIGYGVAIGAGGSAARALEAASFPKLFGIAHLGEIRGVVTAISVASTAFGPLALSLGRDLTGSYVEVLQLLLVLPVGVAVFGLLAPAPTPVAPLAPDGDRSA